MSFADVPYELYDLFIDNMEPADLARFAGTNREMRDLVRSSRAAIRVLDSGTGLIDARSLSLVRAEELETPIKVIGSLDRARVVTHPTLRKFKAILGLTATRRTHQEMLELRLSRWSEEDEEEVALARIAGCVSFLEEWLANTNFPTFDVTVRNRDVGVRLDLSDELRLTFFAQPRWTDLNYNFYKLFRSPAFRKLFQTHPVKGLTCAVNDVPNKKSILEIFPELSEINIICDHYTDLAFLKFSPKLPLKKATVTFGVREDTDMTEVDFERPYDIYINDVTGDLVQNLDPKQIAAVPNVKRLGVPKRQYKRLNGNIPSEKLGLVTDKKDWLLTPLPDSWKKELEYANGPNDESDDDDDESDDDDENVDDVDENVDDDDESDDDESDDDDDENVDDDDENVDDDESD